MTARLRTGLEAASVRLAYGRRDVVTGVDVELRPGRVTALVGPNGSGKSTLLRALAGLHRISGGDLRLDDGSDPRALSARDFARTVTLLTQSRPTPHGLSAREVVEFGRHPDRGRWRSADPDGPASVARALVLTGLDDLADRGVEQLSGGQVQRVWLAACLAQDTAILLLDEPTNHLDLRYQVEILDLLRDLADRHGVTVGVVLHDLDQAAAVADHLVLLAEGRVTAAGPPPAVLDSERLTAAYGVRIEVDVDPLSGAIRTRAIGRHGRSDPARVEERSDITAVTEPPAPVTVE